MSDAWDEEDRVIARALDVDAPEVDAAPSVNPDAVAEYQTVLAQLPFDAIDPRPELESEVVAAALARRPAAALAIDRRRWPTRRSVSSRWIAIGAAVAVAAAIVVALAVGRPGTGPGSPGARIAAAASTDNVARVLADPRTRKGVLRSENGVTDGRVALGADGQGFLYERTPPKSPNAQWLWLDTGSGPVLVGRIATAPTIHFVVHGDLAAVDGVFVTTETKPEKPRTPGPVSSRATLRSVS
ncbi:MAG: hypothetical protein QOG50_3261 [Actinomycetota bacterium]|nr:hypothetical protein [Actinomycetota bacterium]